jgi:excisionase family DNA binding protein
MEGCGRSERRSAVASPLATTPMNCIELVAHRLSTPLIRPSLLRSRGAGAGVHTAKGQRGRIYQGARSARNSAATLSGRALYTVPEAMEMLNLSRRVIYKQIRSGRLLTVTKGRRRLVQASSITAAYVDLLVKKRWLGAMPTRRTRGEGSLDWDESRQRWMAGVDVGFSPTCRFFSRQKATLLPGEFWL